jgi:hypothetical protein
MTVHPVAALAMKPESQLPKELNATLAPSSALARAGFRTPPSNWAAPRGGTGVDNPPLYRANLFTWPLNESDRL